MFIYWTILTILISTPSPFFKGNPVETAMAQVTNALAQLGLQESWSIRGWGFKFFCKKLCSSSMGVAHFPSMGMSENGVYPQWNSHLVGIVWSAKPLGFSGFSLFSDKPVWLFHTFPKFPGESQISWKNSHGPKKNVCQDPGLKAALSRVAVEKLEEATAQQVHQRHGASWECFFFGWY